jgi:NAD(P)-dependent dehydrogenase (short-subunit alcohol dehydrogenase family)
MKDLAGKVILVTGSSSGIGRVTAEELAARGARVWLANRSADRTQPVLDAIRSRGGDAEFLQLELGDLDSVRESAARFLASGEPLHVLINNAGLAGVHGVTKQGFELVFGVNHLGPFLLTRLLLPKLLEQPHSRVVNVSSKAHYKASRIDFAALRRRTRGLIALGEYSVSKLYNVLHAKELARRYGAQGLHSYSLHPGVVASEIWRRIPQPFRAIALSRMISNDEGALTTLHCATSPDVAQQNGLYYDECRIKQPSALAEDAQLARELWEQSERWTS